MSKGIYFKEDIIEELSQELKIPEKEIKEIIDLNIAYIKKSILEKPITLISLPNLAKLRFNLKLGMSSKYTHKKRGSASSIQRREAILKKIDVLTSLEKSNNSLINFNKPLFERLYKKIKHQKAKQVYDKMYHYWAVIERASNELLKKIT